MTNESKERAIRWLTEEVRSLRMAPKVNGCKPDNWAEQLEVMDTCLEAVRSCNAAHIDMEAWGCPLCNRSRVISFKAWEDEEAYQEGGPFVQGGALFCPCCGKPRTPESRAELEKRLRG